MSYKGKKHPETMVSEPMVAYVTEPHQHASFMSMLSGAKLSAKDANDWDILKLTRQGLTKRVLLAMAKKISLTLQEFAAIMHITERTFQRYDDNDVIRAEYSENVSAVRCTASGAT